MALGPRRCVQETVLASPAGPPPPPDGVGAPARDLADLSAAPRWGVPPPTPRRVEASEPRPERVTADDLYQHGLRLLRAGRLPDARDSFAACLELELPAHPVGLALGAAQESRRCDPVDSR